MTDDYEFVEVESRAQWRARLETRHADAPGAWVVTFKARSGHPHVPYPELVEEALCFGWIDSTARTVDEHRSRLRMTPRRRGSNWSASNKERVARLEGAGLMAPAGRAAVDRARQDGTWEALDKVDLLEEPDDLRTALDADPAARQHWDEFPRSTRRAILEWIGAAKRPDTREKRVRETADSAARGVRANQWRQPGAR